MPIIKSFSPFLNLSSFQTFLNDTEPNSRYFRISEFAETFTGGRNGFLIEGSEFLKPSTEVKIEILDVNNNPIYFTPGDGIPEYYEGVSKLISVEVYDDTPIGIGKITILGELQKYVNQDGNVVDVPDEWKGVYNVKWEKEFKINKNLSNESIVRFVKRPKVSITEIEKPIFTKSIPQVTQTGVASGEPSIPAKGTNLSNYTAGTLYKINISDSSNFTSSIDENIISFPSIGYSPTVKEVLSEKTVLVDTPFTVNGLVSDFTDVAYTSTFENLEGTTTEQSTLTGSFAEIFINDLKTFVGDVARVKVYRKSKNEVGDFILVTDTRLESTEMLKDITVATDTELSYGSFSPTNFENYWVTSSNDHVVSFDNTKLFSSIRVDYDNGIGGTQLLHTSRSFNFNTDVEYTLKFKTLLSGSITNNKSLNAFISGTNNFTQSFTNITPDSTFNQRQDISANLVSQYSGSGQLYFEFKGDDWYLSNVSMKNAQETSFSPDEFTLIQEVPRKLPSETFDFRFEFYDINNNFIPVEVFTTKEFNGGNTADTQAVRFLSFESDRTAFRFTTGSIANPQFQQVGFTVSSNGLSGSVSFASSAFDTDGNYIDPSSYGGDYPGLLTNISNQSATLLIGNFTGSVSSVTVGSIVYTASADDLQDFETIFRFEDGENAPALFATTNTNQFIYEPTHLEPKPLVQDLRIQVKRKNLASLITPITANSSSNVPLTEVVDEGGIKTYSLSATEFSSSIISGNDGPYDSVTYSFTASGEFGNEFSDEVTISPVINFDAVSIVLSNESTTFRANSVGSILDDLSEGNGTVSMNIGNQSISHNDGLGSRNTFDIVSVSGTNVTPLSASPTTNLYGISAMSADNGTLDITVDYLAGDNATSQSFSKKVNYGKNRSAPPTIELTTTNKTQNVSANKNGVQDDSFDDATITVQEFYTGSSKTFGSGDVTIDFQSNPSTIATDNGNLTISFANLADGTNSANVIFSASVVDSEGTSRDVVDSISLSKSPAGQDGEGRIVSLTFTDNSIAYNADGTNPDPASITMEASSSGFTSPVFKFTGGGIYFTDETTFTAGTGSNDSATFTSPTSIISTPLTFQVEVQEASDAASNAIDRESVIFVKPGADTRPRFFIKPLNGTQIKNASGNLELQVVRTDSTGSFDISGSAQGDAEIYSGSVKLSTSLTGITDGGNGAEYNPIIAPSAISGTLELTLQETDGTVLDSITLVDVTDGLGGGSFLVPNGLIMRRSGSVYTPSTLGVTASFFDATGSEYRADVSIGSNFNGTLDQMSVTSGSTNSQISFTANDGDDNNITLDGTFANTKDVNIVAVFTESSTGKTNTITETFYIISDGQDGTSAKSIRLSSDAQAFVEAKDGTITPTSITFTANRQNTVNTSTTFGPLSLLSSVGTDSATLTSESFGSNTSVTISGSADSGEVSDEITIVKLIEGSDGITIINTNQAHTFPSDPTGSVLDYGGSGTTISAFEGASALSFDGIGTSAGTFTVSVSQSPNGAFSSAPGGSADGDSVTFGNYGGLSDSIDLVTVTYTLTGKRFNGNAFSGSTTQTFTKSKEGPEAVQVTNTNSSVAVATDSDGLNPDLTDSGTEIQVFEGVNTLTFTTGTPTTSQYSASIVDTNITVGSISGNGTDTLTVGDHSSFNQDSGSIVYTLKGVRANGNDFITQTTQNFKKIRAGSDGAQGPAGPAGTNGADAITISVSPASQIVSASTDASIDDPSPFTVTVNQTGSLLTHTTSTLSNGTFKILNLTNGTLTGGSGTTTPSITPGTVSSFVGLETTFDVQYQDSNGNTSDNLPETHSVSVVLDGQTGPGIVHTGVWESGRAYQFGTGATGRRDSVLWESSTPGTYDTYYAATAQHTSTTTGTNGPPTVGDNWESLGQQDLFVAAKIGIFEDSFIQNTLNIGSSNNGGVSSANITLFGGSDSGGSSYPYLSMGQASSTGEQGYGVGAGIFLGRDSTDDEFKFSIEKTGVYEFINLGNSPFSSGVAYSTYPNTTTGVTVYGLESILDQNTKLYTNSSLSTPYDGSGIGSFTYLSDGDTVVQVDSGGNVTVVSGYTSSSPGSVLVSSSNNALKWNGNSLEISGSIVATDGTIGGFSITSDAIQGPDVSGIPRFFISGAADDTDHFISASNFSLKGNGDITGSSVLFSGGTIAGWDITDSELQGGTPSGGGDGSFTTQGIRLGADGYVSAKNFYLDSTGNAQFAGTVSATAGNIAGFTIVGNTLDGDSGAIILDANNSSITLDDGTNRLDMRTGNLTTTATSANIVAGGNLMLNNQSYSGFGSDSGETNYTNFTLSSDGQWTGNITISQATTDIDPSAAPVAQGNVQVVTGIRIRRGNSSTGTIVYDSAFSAVTWETGDSTQTSTATRTQTANITNTGTNTYYVNQYYTVDYFVSQGDVEVTAIAKTTSTQTITLGQDVVELTTGGIQVTSAADEYVRIQKGASYKLDIYGNWRVKNNVNETRIYILDSNDDGMLWGLDTNGNFFMAPVDAGTNEFSRELKFIQSTETWQFDHNVDVNGTLSKGGGSFKIPHPLTELSGSTSLIHSFIEGPQADLIYRGKSSLTNGSVQINLDNESGMTEGTFEALNTNVQCFTSNETSWNAVRGYVNGNILTIECENTSSNDEISWMVIGERDDDTIKKLDLTDENGKVKVEIPRN